MPDVGDVVEAENAVDLGYDDVSDTPTRPHSRFYCGLCQRDCG